jgi:hypothetical protein
MHEPCSQQTPPIATMFAADLLLALQDQILFRKLQDLRRLATRY